MPKQPLDTDVAETAGGPKSDTVAAELAEARSKLEASQLELKRVYDELQKAGVRERMLAHEVRHRVHNMLGVIQSIFRRTLETGASREEFAEHFAGRVSAMSRYQGAIASLDCHKIELQDMVREELLTVQCMEGPDCKIKGPSVCLLNNQFELMGLAIHELVTNSVKFGALCHRGKLTVEWAIAGSPEALHFRWRETGVPLISTAPRAQGFGMDLIEQALPYQLGATSTIEFKPGGIDCRIVFPLSMTKQSTPDERNA